MTEFRYLSQQPRWRTHGAKPFFGMHLRPFLLLLLSLPVHGADDELLSQIRTAGAPPAFATHRPVFTFRDEQVTMQTPKGPQTVSMALLRDGERVIGVWDAGMCQLDLITRPDRGLATFHWPTRYHWAELIGTRVSLALWYDGQYVSSQEHPLTVSGQGTDTLVLTFAERWTRKRKATSQCTATLRLDPVLGYALTLDYAIDTDDGRTKHIEFCNVIPGQVSSPWPDEWRYDRTLRTPEAGGIDGFWNNTGAMVAANRHMPKGIRNGGFIAWTPDADGWGVGFSHLENTGRSQLATCNVWADQHNMVSLPEKPDADGRFRFNARFRLSGIPPLAVQRLESQATMHAMNGESQVMVKLDVPEDFESQPVPLTSALRGVLLGDVRIDTAKAHTGSRSLAVNGIPADKPIEGNGFSIAPQIRLVANCRYRISGWALVEGDAGTTAVVRGTRYEYSPHDPQRLGEPIVAGPVAAGAGWQPFSVEFDSGALGPFIDLRFLCLGAGTAWFDDLHIQRLP